MPKAATGSWWSKGFQGKITKKRSTAEKLALLHKAAGEGGVRGFIGQTAEGILDTRIGRVVKNIALKTG